MSNVGRVVGPRDFYSKALAGLIENLVAVSIVGSPSDYRFHSDIGVNLAHVRNIIRNVAGISPAIILSIVCMSSFDFGSKVERRKGSGRVTYTLATYLTAA